MPDLIQQSQLELLQKWNGELRFLQNFKLRRFSHNFLYIGHVKSRPSSPNHKSINDISQKEKTASYALEHMDIDNK